MSIPTRPPAYARLPRLPVVYVHTDAPVYRGIRALRLRRALGQAGPYLVLIEIIRYLARIVGISRYVALAARGRPAGLPVPRASTPYKGQRGDRRDPVNQVPPGVRATHPGQEPDITPYIVIAMQSIGVCLGTPLAITCTACRQVLLKSMGVRLCPPRTPSGVDARRASACVIGRPVAAQDEGEAELVFGSCVR